MGYRRADVKGRTYFVTVNLAEGRRTIRVDHIDVLRMVMKKMKASHSFRMDAMVSFHSHAVWTLPEADAHYPTRWVLIKAGFSRCLPKALQVLSCSGLALKTML